MIDEIYNESDRVISIILSCTGESLDEENINPLSIREDVEGKDIVCFECPRCQEIHESFRVC